MMTRRDRLTTALRCGEPDRPPVRVLRATPSAAKWMHKSWHRLLNAAMERTEIIELVGLPAPPTYSAGFESQKEITEEPMDQPGFVKRTLKYETPRGRIYSTSAVNKVGRASVDVKYPHCLIENLTQKK